ncbi:MAG TPA: DoxX family protein [Burkholderiaceae bacterium]|nr:DoxX family protein [Burkholderiaceae bacterium]
MRRPARGEWALSYSSRAADGGRLLLRVALGVLILLHGIAKLKTGPVGVMAAVGRSDLPAFLAYGVYIGEVLAPLLLIVGLWTRAAALIVAINMLFAIGLVHMADLGTISRTGGWALELQGMYLASALAVALLGAGRFSVGGAEGRWN